MKKSQPLYGIHHAFEEDAFKFCKERKVHFWREEFLLLARIACHPQILSMKSSAKLKIEFFGRMFSEKPDEVIELLRFIRKRLDDLKNSATGMIRIFLLTHSVVRMRNGKAANAKNGILRAVSDLTAVEIARLVFPSVSETVLNKCAELVKAERKNLRRKLEPREFWERPDVISYMRTGKKSGELKRKTGE